MVTEDEYGSGSKSNKQRFETLEENQERLFKSLTELITSLAHIVKTNQKSYERFKQRMIEIKERESIDRRTHGKEQREVIQETRRTHKIRLPLVEPEYETDEKNKEQVTVQESKELTIDVVSPHIAQVVAIEDTLGHKDKNIDGFTIRSNIGGSIGSLSKPQRINIALSKDRHCLWIFGILRYMSW
ncbi:hypothetical protein ACOSQ3_031740 [Xanthoceras sorbifolium]